MSNNAKVQAMIISDREHKTRALTMNIYLQTVARSSMPRYVPRDCTRSPAKSMLSVEMVNTCDVYNHGDANADADSLW